MGAILFSKEHIWIKEEENTAKLGISDYAQEKLGNILFLNLPDSDDKLLIGNTFGDIESIKTVSDLISPIDAKVISVNEDLVDEPNVINSKPYESWFMEVEVLSKSDDLMTESEYKEYIKTL